MPKKSGKKGGKKKELDPAELLASEKLNKAESEIVCLQQQLDVRENDRRVARQTEREWRFRVDEFSNALEQQRENTLDVASDMSRQYKAMQEKLLQQIDGMEVEQERLRGEIAERDRRAEEQRLRYEQELSAKEAKILELQQRLSDVAVEFSGMLKETLERVGKTLDRD
mmetsp:Transcript_4043/g.14134  ORF Transcript_4043/g.14134 Transcript_4043/m.14134 type:complete len:169 (-) Transcript_4043:112-618(-)